MKKLKNLLVLCFISVCFASFGQLPYSWVVGVNPGWSASTSSNNTLGWQSCANYVSTSNCVGSYWYKYNNNQNTTYTSPIKNTICTLSSQVRVSFNISVILENNYDFLYFEYSLNGGTTWVQVGTYTGSISGIQTYMLNTSINTRFRFRFTSDYSVNSYGTNIYYADIESFNVDCVGVLPIELLSFDATANQNQVDLSWATASERNNDFFTIERTSDGITYEEIAQVEGQGNSSTEINYKYTDVRPLHGVSYYRLKQTDFNGESEAFEPVSVYFINTKDYIKLYPNPNKGSFELEFYSDINRDNVELTILDSQGKVVLKRLEKVKGGLTVKKIKPVFWSSYCKLFRIL